jgi:hypothetical protein
MGAIMPNSNIEVGDLARYIGPTPMLVLEMIEEET